LTQIKTAAIAGGRIKITERVSREKFKTDTQASPQIPHQHRKLLCWSRHRNQKETQMTGELRWVGVAILIILAAVILSSAIKVFREYERGVVFNLGRFWKVKGPGLVIIIPAIQQVIRVDLRTVVLEVPTQDVISRDNVSVKVSAVVYFRVVDAQKAIIQVVDYLNATSQLAQTMLRSVLGKHHLDDMLAEREKLNLDIQQALDMQTDTWGIKVSNVEIKQVDLTESMVRAIARQAEAERERRAKVIHAEGELQASEKLFQAAKVLAQEPQAILLRYLETLTVIGADKNTTIVFPLPMDLVAPLLERLKQGAGEAVR
jgi:regulator of protease activity HflC (stomatin/prohibitin superfamily)